MRVNQVDLNLIKKTPPHSLEAEKAVLGNILMNNENLSAVLSIISPEAFYKEAHKKIVAKMATLINKGTPTDVVTLSEALQGDGMLEEVGGVSYLSSLMDGVPKSLNVEFYASIIKKKFLFRQLILWSTNICISSYEQKEEADIILDKAQASMVEFTDKCKEVKKVEDFSISTRVDAIKEFISMKRKAEYLGLEITCFKKLTEALNGLREIIVIAALPKVGKTALALQIASDIAKQNYGVLYYDFESGAENLIIRELCRNQNISYQEIFKEENPGSSVDCVEAGLNNLREYKNFIIKTERNLKIEEIKSDVLQVRQLAEKREVLIVIDSLQKLPMTDLKDRRAAIDRWLRDFEALKTNDPYLTIILISELSREKHQPKESGDIEYTGHFLLRLETNLSESEMKKGDDHKRKIRLEYGRDVALKKPIPLRADFEHWEFKEEDDF